MAKAGVVNEMVTETPAVEAVAETPLEAKIKEMVKTKKYDAEIVQTACEFFDNGAVVTKVITKTGLTFIV